MKKIDETIQKYVEWEEIPKEEYELAKSQLPSEEFDKQYRSHKDGGLLGREHFQKAMAPTIDDIQYMVAVDTLDEIKKLREDQTELKREVRTIKLVALFFAVLTAISLIVSIAAAATTAAAMDKTKSTISRYFD